MDRLHQIHLRSPYKEGIAPLKGERAFVMEMEDNEKVINKVGKKFELTTKARKLCFHLKSDTRRDNYAHTIFQKLVTESYYEGTQLEFMALTKLEIVKDFAFSHTCIQRNMRHFLGMWDYLQPREDQSEHSVEQRGRGFFGASH